MGDVSQATYLEWVLERIGAMNLISQERVRRCIIEEILDAREDWRRGQGESHRTKCRIALQDEPWLCRCCRCEDESSKYVKSFPWRMRNGFVSETRTESGDRDSGGGGGHGNDVALIKQKNREELSKFAWGAHEEPGEEVIMGMCKERDLHEIPFPFPCARS